MAKRKQLEWTPPIFGWQYRLIWSLPGDQITVTSWDWEHWPKGSKYHISVDGSAHDTSLYRVYWTVFFIVRSSSIGVRFVESSYSLRKAIRGIEHQVKDLEGAILELRGHSKRAGT